MILLIIIITNYISLLANYRIISLLANYAATKKVTISVKGKTLGILLGMIQKHRKRLAVFVNRNA